MKRYALILIAATVGLLALSARADYQPKAERVTENVYAIVGPLGQRSADNDGLNANYGFVVTPDGVILIDSGASRLGAEKLAAAIAKVTQQPVRWVVNTGSQDHRWLGNDYFAGKGAEVIALTRTAATQAEYANQQMAGLERFLGERLKGTQPLPAPKTLAGDSATLERGGVTLELAYTDAHYPGDARVWLPKQRVVFSGDLIYVDRLLGDLAQAQRETGDYYDFLVDKVGAAAREMESLSATLDRYADLPAFRHLENYGDLHRANMSRAFTEFESP